MIQSVRYPGDTHNKSHQRDSRFFVSPNFLSFHQQVRRIRIPDPDVPHFTQLSFKCCGYGYFSEYKKIMKANFLNYLKDAIKSCKNLVTLKIIYNGFGVNEKEGTDKELNDNGLTRLYQIVRSIGGRNLKTLWIKTTNIRNCKEQDLTGMLGIIDKFGLKQRCQQIDIQMSDWEFANGYLRYNSIIELFELFLREIVANLYYKKFRLEISSWYYRQKQAYQFLKDALGVQEILRYFQSTKNDSKPVVNRATFSKLPEEERDPLQIDLVYFLQHMEDKILYPIKRYKKYSQKQQKQKIEKEWLEKTEQIQKKYGGTNNYNQQMLKVQNDKIDRMRNVERYVFEKNAEIELKENQHKQMLQKIKMVEENLSKRLVKYPKDLIVRLRVQQFHGKMIQFIQGLLNKLEEVQEYHIDMRNWHKIFDMTGLKKTLDTKLNESSNKQQFSINNKISIRPMNKSSREPLKKEGVQEQVGLKTIYIM